jgi:sortase A
VRRWLARLMFVAGAACVGWVFVTWEQATFFQLYARSELQRLISDTKPPAAGLFARTPAPLRPDESVVGLLAIPRLSLSVIAVEGDDSHALRIAAGHLSDTPLPWHDGNATFAGHRDTFFHALSELRVGDDIHITTRHGEFSYHVTRTLIVNPTDLSILQPHDGTALTLITCYPFSYIGDAPQRFVVQAARTEEDPES